MEHVRCCQGQVVLHCWHAPYEGSSAGFSDCLVQQAQVAALLVCAYQSPLSELAAQPGLPF